MLKLGTLKCPIDKAVLHFEVWGMMRVKHPDGKEWKYKARCPDCKAHYDVKAPKEPK